MAAIRTYNDAWVTARMQYSRSLEPSAQQAATNMGIAKLWRAWDWKGSVVDLPPFWLVPNVQDYDNVPTDYLGLREAYVVQPNGTDPLWSPQLKPVHNMEATNLPGLPTAIGYLDKGGVFRIDTRPNSGVCAPFYMIGGTYKKQPLAVALADLMNVLPFDDQYFDAVVAAFAWAAKVCSGQVSLAAEGEQFFYSVLNEVLGETSRERGDNYPHPAESVMGSYNVTRCF